MLLICSLFLEVFKYFFCKKVLFTLNGLTGYKEDCGTRRVFNDLIDDFTKSDFKSFWDDFEIF
jgi:hypothetical protein